MLEPPVLHIAFCSSAVISLGASSSVLGSSSAIMAAILLLVDILIKTRDRITINSMAAPAIINISVDESELPSVPSVTVRSISDSETNPASFCTLHITRYTPISSNAWSTTGPLASSSLFVSPSPSESVIASKSHEKYRLVDSGSEKPMLSLVVSPTTVLDSSSYSSDTGGVES